MVEFETLETRDINFGNNKFLEVARKKAKTPEGETEFISISKGFMLPTGKKRFKNALGFEANKEIIDDLIEAFKSIREVVGQESPKTESTESDFGAESEESTEEKVE